MLALTLIQPWATAIMTLGKDVENRKWAPSTKQLPPGARFAIHAGAKLDRAAAAFISTNLGIDYERLIAVPCGALLGTVEFVDVFGNGLVPPRFWPQHNSRWRNPDERFGWAVRAPRPLTTPIPSKGYQKLWRVPVEHLSALEAL